MGRASAGGTGPVAAAVLVLAALVAGVVVATWQTRIARRERAIAERRFEDMRALANVAWLDSHDAIRDLPAATRLALAGRADAGAECARPPAHRSTRDEDLAAAERDYAESVAIFTELQQSGAIQRTDLELQAISCGC